MDIITIYRGASIFTEIKLEDSSTQNKAVMGENVINLSFKFSQYIKFALGDWCTVFGEVYRLNEDPIVKTTASNYFEYSIKMQAEGSDLAKAQYLGLGFDNVLRESEFALMGNAETFIDLMLQNVARVSDGFEKGEIIKTSYKLLTFSKENCLGVLSRIAQEFNTEFWLDGKTINITKKSNDTGFSFSVGYNRGLHEITRVNINNSGIVTRLYAYGADKNLPPGYSGNRLHLARSNSPVSVVNVSWTVNDLGDGTQDIIFDWLPPTSDTVKSVAIHVQKVGGGFVNSYGGSVNSPRTINVPVGVYDVYFYYDRTPLDGDTSDTFRVDGTGGPSFIEQIVPYIEKNVDLYGVIENTVYFDDIFPHRTGKVTSVNAADPFSIIDTTIDFDINDYLLPGLTAKITFNTGQLAGFTFDISAYDNVNKEFTFLKNKNETKIDVPSALFKAAIGDEYVLTDIQMPAEYVEAAQIELYKRAKEVLDDYSSPQYTIQAVIDPKFMISFQRELALGDAVWIVDRNLEIDRKIRITAIVRNLVRQTAYQVTLTDVISPGGYESLVLDTASTQRDVSSLGNTINSQDIFNGRLVLPQTAGGAGFQEVVVETATNKVYRKV